MNKMTDEDDDEDRGVPCCVLDTARWVTKIKVGKNNIGVTEFQRIIDEVLEMGPMEDEDEAVQLRSTPGGGRLRRRHAQGVPESL